jgi:FkbM family methyltransferase
MLHTVALYGMNFGGGGLVEESGEEWVLAQVVRPRIGSSNTPVIFDVGANVGEYTLTVRRHLPSARIFAFEPARSVYEELARRVEQTSGNGFTALHNIGFSDSPKSVDLYSYAADGVEATMMASIDLRLPTQVVDVRAIASERIEVQTIDSFCEKQQIDRIDFLKMDVEGHEMAVLRGAKSMLDANRISMIQFEFGPPNISSQTYFYDFWSLLSEKFDIYRIVPRGIARIGYYGEHREIFLNINYLAILRESLK